MKKLLACISLLVGCNEKSTEIPPPTKEDVQGVIEAATTPKILDTKNSSDTKNENTNNADSKKGVEQLATIVHNAIIQSSGTPGTGNKLVEQVKETVQRELAKPENELALEELQKYCLKTPEERNAILEQFRLSGNAEKAERILAELERICRPPVSPMPPEFSPDKDLTPEDIQALNEKIKEFDPSYFDVKQQLQPSVFGAPEGAKIEYRSYVRDDKGNLYYAMDYSLKKGFINEFVSGIAVSKDSGKTWQLIKELSTSLSVDTSQVIENIVCGTDVSPGNNYYPDSVKGYGLTVTPRAGHAGVATRLLPHPTSSGVIVYRAREIEEVTTKYTCPKYRTQDCHLTGTCLAQADIEYGYKSEYAFERYVISGDTVKAKQILSNDPQKRVAIRILAGKNHTLFRYPVNYINKLSIRDFETLVPDPRSAELKQQCTNGPAAGYRSQSTYVTRAEKHNLTTYSTPISLNHKSIARTGTMPAEDAQDWTILKYESGPIITSQESTQNVMENVLGNKKVSNFSQPSYPWLCRQPYVLTSEQEDIYTRQSPGTQAETGTSSDGGETFTWAPTAANVYPRFSATLTEGCTEAMTAKIKEAGAQYLRSCFTSHVPTVPSQTISGDFSFAQNSLVLDSPNGEQYGVGLWGKLCKFDASLKANSFDDGCKALATTTGFQSGYLNRVDGQFDTEGNLHLVYIRTGATSVDASGVTKFVYGEDHYPFYEFIPAWKFAVPQIVPPKPNVRHFYSGECDDYCTIAQGILTRAGYSVTPALSSTTSGELKETIDEYLEGSSNSSSVVLIENTNGTSKYFPIHGQFDRLGFYQELKRHFSEPLIVDGSWKFLARSTSQFENTSVRIGLANPRQPVILAGDSNGIHTFAYADTTYKNENNIKIESRWSLRSFSPPTAMQPPRFPTTSPLSQMLCGNFDALYFADNQPNTAVTTNLLTLKTSIEAGITRCVGPFVTELQ